MHTTSKEEQQALGGFSDISQNIKALVAPMKEWVREQDETDKQRARVRLLTGTSRS